MMTFLAGPLFRQLIQFGAGAIATTGVASGDEVTTVFGALMSLVNVGWVVYTRLTVK